MKLLAALDLMAAARVRPAIEALGHGFVLCPRDTDLVSRAKEERADAILLDLSGIEGAVGVVQALKAALPELLVIGVAGHVQEALLALAREAGADAVLTKGELPRRLAELLQA
ncbi:MAG: response regulator transcription factor [Deltaproteobacteria bacterium]